MFLLKSCLTSQTTYHCQGVLALSSCPSLFPEAPPSGRSSLTIVFQHCPLGSTFYFQPIPTMLLNPWTRPEVFPSPSKSSSLRIGEIKAGGGIIEKDDWEIPQIGENSRSSINPKQINIKKITPRHITIILLNMKDKVLKTTRPEQWEHTKITYRRTMIMLWWVKDSHTFLISLREEMEFISMPLKLCWFCACLLVTNIVER